MDLDLSPEIDENNCSYYLVDRWPFHNLSTGNSIFLALNDEIVHEGFWEDRQWNIVDLTM